MDSPSEPKNWKEERVKDKQKVWTPGQRTKDQTMKKTRSDHQIRTSGVLDLQDSQARMSLKDDQELPEMSKEWTDLWF